MQLTNIIVATVFFLAAVACLGSLSRLSQLHQRDVRVGLGGLLATVGFWSLLQAIQMLTLSESIATSLFTGGLIIGFATPFVWLYFCSAYTGRTLHTERPYIWSAVVLYTTMVVIKITNPIHGQYFTAEIATEPYPRLLVNQGDIYWISFIIAYAMTAIGIFFLIQTFYHSRRSTWKLTGLVGITGLSIFPKIVSGLYPSLLPALSYEPIGVAIFAIGALYLTEDTFVSLEAPVRNQLFEESDKGIISITPDGNIYEYNEKAVEFIPSLNEYTGSIDELLSKLSVDQLTEDAEIIEVERNGEEHYYLLTVQPVRFDSHQIGRTLLLQNVTQRQQKAKELQLFRKAVENAGQAILITDRDGQIRYVNDSFEAQTGYSEDEILGQTPNTLNSGKQSASYYTNFWNTIIDGGLWEDTLINQRKSGELYTIEQKVAPLTDDDGEVTHFVGITSDVTKQRRQKQQLTVLNRILRHNLRNGINVIQGYTALLEEHADNEIQPFVDAIENRADDLAETSTKAGKLRSFLDKDFSPEASLDACDLLKTVQSEFRESHPPVSISVTCCDQTTVRADRRLQVAINELVNNAVTHNECSDLEITLRIEQSKMGSDTEWVDIIVEDNGSGIPSSERKILEKGEETPLQHGSGLGLWLVHWTVDLFGGDVDIRASSPGTRITVSLLAADDSNDNELDGQRASTD